MKRVGLVAMAALLSGGATACYPGSISDVGEADLVLTVRDTAFDFASLSTYFLIDSVTRVGAPEGDVDGAFDGQILTRIASELEGLGYTPVDVAGGDPPDVVIAVGVSTTTFAWWAPGACWYCWYRGYPGWGPGWGYAGYPAYPWLPVGDYGGPYRAGSLAIVMANPLPGPGEPEVHWGGVVNGLLSGGAEDTGARAHRLIAQLFEQSPYLATN